MTWELFHFCRFKPHVTHFIKVQKNFLIILSYKESGLLFMSMSTFVCSLEFFNVSYSKSKRAVKIIEILLYKHKIEYLYKPFNESFLIVYFYHKYFIYVHKMIFNSYLRVNLYNSYMCKFAFSLYFHVFRRSFT